MSDKVHYADTLVEIDEDTILFRNYYYPFGPKRIPVSNIRKILYYHPKYPAP